MDGDLHLEYYDLHKTTLKFIGNMAQQKFWVSAWHSHGRHMPLNGFFYGNEFINGQINGKSF